MGTKIHGLLIVQENNLNISDLAGFLHFFVINAILK